MLVEDKFVEESVMLNSQMKIARASGNVSHLNVCAQVFVAVLGVKGRHWARRNHIIDDD